MSGEQFDIMIPFGPACRPAYHLEKEMLRTNAFPMDWMICTDIKKMVELYKNSFRGFFVDCLEDKEESLQHEKRYVIDTNNDIISMHHFEKDITLRTQIAPFQEKMLKRFQRLDRAIKDANRVALLCNRWNAIEELEWALSEFAILYPDTDITMINVRDCGVNKVEEDISLTRKTISSVLRIHDWMISDTYRGNNKTMWWIGNEVLWEQILDNYRLTSLPLIETLKKYNNIIVYGAGKGCKRIMRFLKKYDVPVKGIAVTDMRKNPAHVEGVKVNEISQYDQNCTILISIMDKDEGERVKRNLVRNGYEVKTIKSFMGD